MLSLVLGYMPGQTGAGSGLLGLRYGGKSGDLPVTEDISDRLLRLPFFYALTDAEQARVIEAVRTFKP